MIRPSTLEKLRDTNSSSARFKKGDFCRVRRVFADDSQKMRSKIGWEGLVIGYREYQGNGPGNRYYVAFQDGEILGFEGRLLCKV
jgi:hypothetical protein